MRKSISQGLTKILLGAGLSFALSGCYTVYFHNGESKSQAVDGSDWHHGGGIFGLFEFTQPQNPSADCPTGWTSVRTRDSFVTGLVSAVIPWGIYTPKEYSYDCADAGSKKAKKPGKAKAKAPTDASKAARGSKKS
jgi:hypothetical protein